ncbi:hypothetical protein XENOCAPTIV_025971, partial [Xenoophorus captivus]
IYLFFFSPSCLILFQPTDKNPVQQPVSKYRELSESILELLICNVKDTAETTQEGVPYKWELVMSGARKRTCVRAYMHWGEGACWDSMIMSESEQAANLAEKKEGCFCQQK